MTSLTAEREARFKKNFYRVQDFKASLFAELQEEKDATAKDVIGIALLFMEAALSIYEVVDGKEGVKAQLSEALKRYEGMQ